MDTSKRTLLIAEDNAAIQAVYKKVFERAGFNVVGCDNAAQAMAELTEQKIDLLITDLEMPKANTLELFPYLKEKYPKMPVIVVTGHYRNLEEDFRSKGLKISAFFNKPIEVQVLLLKIQELLGQEKSVVRS